MVRRVRGFLDPDIGHKVAEGEVDVVEVIAPVGP
jgi:hypothetical protein